jgi:hypothetical protein
MAEIDDYKSRNAGRQLRNKVSFGLVLGQKEVGQTYVPVGQIDCGNPEQGLQA